MTSSDAMNDVRQTIREYVLGSYLASREAETFRDDEDLLTILDSLQILRMLLDLEEKFDIKVETSELSPENLGTVERLAAFITRKRRVSSC